MVDDVDDLLVVMDEEEHVVDAQTERQEGDDLGGGGVEVDVHPRREAETGHTRQGDQQHASEA